MRQYKKTVIYCCVGYIVQAIVNNLLPLFFVIFRTEYNLSTSKLGSIILMNFMIQLFVDILATKFGARIGYRRSMIIAHVFAALGLVSVTLLPIIIPDTYVALLIATLLFAIGGGLMEVMASPLMDSIDFGSKSAAMNFLHSFYCWGQVLVVGVTTLLLMLFGTKNWYIIPIIWAVIPFLNIFPFIKAPLPPMLPEEKRVPLKTLFKTPKFLLLVIIMVCSGAFELTMSQLSSFFAEKGLGVSKTVGDLLGPCLFAMFMGIARLTYSIKGDKLPLRNSMIFCCSLGVACYLMVGISTNVWVSLMGCALCGFSVGIMWPGALSLAGRSFKGGTAMFGILAVSGDLGCSVGPFITGIISDFAEKNEAIIAYGRAIGLDSEQTAIKLGLLAAGVFPFIALICLINEKRRSRNSK